MSYKTGTASGHIDMFRIIRRYLTGSPDPGTPAYSGTGDGTLDDFDTLPLAPTETWTIACTDATTPGSEVWSVTGSVSGAQAAATTGVDYDNGYIRFKITAGATNFVVTDSWTVAVTVGPLNTSGEAWDELEYGYDSALDQWYSHLMAEGLTGTEEIYGSIGTYQDADSDYYNLKIAGHTGHLPGREASFDQQPGTTAGLGVPCWNQNITYWICANAQRAVVVMKIETVYTMFYLGKIYGYGSPEQYPYPVLAAAPLASAGATRYSSTGYHNPFHPASDACMIYKVGTGFENCSLFPPDNYLSDQIRDTGGDHALVPLILYSTNFNIWGELDGVYYISGWNQAVENTVTIGADTYLVVHDVWRTGFPDYVAVKLA